jgi:hypothetical protein
VAEVEAPRLLDPHLAVSAPSRSEATHGHLQPLILLNHPLGYSDRA